MCRDTTCYVLFTNLYFKVCNYCVRTKRCVKNYLSKNAVCKKRPCSEPQDLC